VRLRTCRPLPTRIGSKRFQHGTLVALGMKASPCTVPLPGSLNATASRSTSATGSWSIYWRLERKTFATWKWPRLALFTARANGRSPGGPAWAYLRRGCWGDRWVYYPWGSEPNMAGPGQTPTSVILGATGPEATRTKGSGLGTVKASSSIVWSLDRYRRGWQSVRGSGVRDHTKQGNYLGRRRYGDSAQGD